MTQQTKKKATEKASQAKSKKNSTATPKDVDIIKNLATLLTEQSAGNAVALAVPEGLEDTDLICFYSIRVMDYQGNIIVKNTGTASLSGIGDAEALPEAPTIFETTFHSVVWRPVRNRFMRWINKRVGTSRALPEIENEGSYGIGKIISGSPLGG
jgi:hypothetical protein